MKAHNAFHPLSLTRHPFLLTVCANRKGNYTVENLIINGACILNRYVMIGIGAALGANGRYLIGVWFGQRFGTEFPWWTLFVNVVGSFLLGFLLTMTTEQLHISSEMRLLFAVGFLGSFTTFSSFSVESMTLFQTGHMASALINILLNNGAGLLCALLGIQLARFVQESFFA